MTKGTYLATSCSANDTTLYVGDTTDFPAPGGAQTAWIIDSANDRDAFTYTGKTATTLTGIPSSGASAVLAHTVSAANKPLVVPAVKGIYISDAVNEARLFDESEAGVVREIVSLTTDGLRLVSENGHNIGTLGFNSYNENAIGLTADGGYRWDRCWGYPGSSANACSDFFMDQKSVHALIQTDYEYTNGYFWGSGCDWNQLTRRFSFGILDNAVARSKTIINMDDGSVAIGTTTFADDELLRVNGDIYCDANIAADSYSEFSSYYDGDAVSEILKIKGKDGKPDHDTLPEFVRKTAKKHIYEEREVTYKEKAKGRTLKRDGKLYESVKIGTEDQPTKDLGRAISMLEMAIKQLHERIDKLEKKQ
jgi:hypothetical protein